MSATSGTRASVREVRLPRTAGVTTFVMWIGVSLLGFPIGGYLGHLVAGPVDGVLPALLGGAVTGAGIGFAQWLLLRRRFEVGLGWIAATSIGLAVGLAVGASVVGYETATTQLTIIGAISGAFVGVAQGTMLRERSSLWVVWIFAMPALWALGWVVTDAWGIDVAQRFTVFGASGSVAFAILSGPLLIAGARGTRLAGSSA